ncbi:MAG: hypothetical protein HC898_05510 [Phycisphaerales bacterium]|nr:hypothetical protein [Phycisphaerales bacterium]
MEMKKIIHPAGLELHRNTAVNQVVCVNEGAQKGAQPANALELAKLIAGMSEEQLKVFCLLLEKDRL